MYNNNITYFYQSKSLGGKKMENETKNRSTIGGVVFVGCIIIGLALGLLYQNVVVGILLGVGGGFIAMGAVWAIIRPSKDTDK